MECYRPELGGDGGAGSQDRKLTVYCYDDWSGIPPQQVLT